MAIKTLNTLLSLIPTGDETGKGGNDQTPPENGNGDTNDTNDTNGGDDTGENSRGDDTEGGAGGDKSGGGVGNDDKVGMDDFKDIASDIANEVLNGGDGGLKDKDDAVEDVVTEERELVNNENVQEGEAAYAPTSTSDDKVVKVPNATDYNGEPLNKGVLEASASLTAPLRTGLQRLVRGLETNAIRHGTRTGRSLSERRYATTWGAIKTGKKVKRAYKRKTDKLDTSIAVSIVVDQSGSMYDKLVPTQMGMIALANAISDIGGKCEVIGYRSGWNRHRGGGDIAGAHRDHPVTIDVFMDYGDRFHNVKDRFSRLRADGYTPTADGIQYGLEGLSICTEAHRVMFVLTDGEADYTHRPVIKRQIRLAKEAGIRIIGVGLGQGTENVINEYEDSVYAHNMSELPRLLLEKLTAVFDPSEKHRGKKVRSA